MIRRLLLSFFMLLWLLSLRGQQYEMDLYDYLNEDLQRVFCEYCKERCEAAYISSAQGQYVGHTMDGSIFGWGYFLAENGGQIVGMYRDGKCFFGITLDGKTATVGGGNHYVVYSLNTGRIIKSITPDGEVVLPDEVIDTHTFRKVNYKNGDCYYGELLNNQPHGYGIYYWTNGDFWYGRFANGYRMGFGALFKPDYHVYYGKWVADDKVE